MLLSSLLALLPLSQASPVEKRSCAVEVPTFIGTIDSMAPDFVSNPLGTAGTTLAFKDPNVVRAGVPTKGLAVDTLIEFNNIPQGSWGCQLEMYFQQGYWTIYDYPPGPNRINVWNVNKEVPHGNNYSLSWNNAPQPISLFGSVGQIDLPSGGPYSQDVKKVVNSAACQTKMTWRVSVPSDVVQGGLQFIQQPSPFGGWRLVHNC